MSNGAARNARELAGLSSRRELKAAAFLAREARQSGSGRVHSARGDAVEVMRALGADERGHHRRTDDIWRTGGALDVPDGELLSESSDAISV